MTDNEIIKALECCTRLKYCDTCPFNHHNCKKMLDYTLDLIKRQQAEIEILEQSCQEMSKDVKRLWKDCDFFEDKAKNTAKVFAEKLKKSLTGWDSDPTDEEIEYVIDKLLKEMEGANNDR